MASSDPEMLTVDVVQEISEDQPGKEINNGTGDKEWHIQISGLGLKNFVTRDDLRMGPFVQIMNSEKNREKEQSH